ncbi:hypothetical protein L1987_05642 [Smallanthus sonchifolius]|uniref:Uncharacterized protein n=1 Tax=Smallanthus sonchifolius TaxID=185202 RepID=A0ACB9JW38_9ASTR|nr:hypothetical protein L1987_05642 [Smallanthus sonchifolius]
MDDGSYYFDDKHIDVSGHQGPLSATAAVIPEDKILGLARFFLGIGVPGNSKDLVSVPLVLSLPATVLSLTSKDKLKVKVSTVLGSIAPPLSELHFDPKEAIHMLDALPVGVDIGKYVFAFEIVLSDPEDKRKFATGGRTKVPVHVTGVVKVDDAKVAVLEGDIVESEKKYDFLGLVEKFFYLSGQYDIELTVGDAVMENSFLQPLVSIELDLPKAPEKATQPPPQAVNP